MFNQVGGVAHFMELCRRNPILDFGEFLFKVRFLLADIDRKKFRTFGGLTRNKYKQTTGQVIFQMNEGYKCRKNRNDNAPEKGKPNNAMKNRPCFFPHVCCLLK